jgi:hypothetical protein
MASLFIRQFCNEAAHILHQSTARQTLLKIQTAYEKAKALGSKSCVIFTRVRKIAKSDSQLRHVCPSVRPSTWTEFH